MDFADKLNEYIGLVNREIGRVLTVPNCYQKVVYEAMEYSLKAGGKRVRPVLALAVCEMLGGDVTLALPHAAAIEMIHTYSLIHDDLPCMDNDDLRRGRPTCHKVFGEAVALLAGDGLLTAAFEVMSADVKLSSSSVLGIINKVSIAVGCDGMIGGQVIDMLCEGGADDVTVDKLQAMHINKTAKLIEVSAMVGAIAAGANDDEVAKISNFSNNLGLAFQVKDDILDIIGDENELGKTLGKDIERGKATFVTLLGLDESQRILDKLTNCAMSELKYFGEESEFLEQISKYLLERKN